MAADVLRHAIRPTRVWGGARRASCLSTILLAARRLFCQPSFWFLLASAAGADAQPLRLAVSRGTVSLPVYVAEAKGYFQREGVDVRLVECTSGHQCFQLLSRGEADLATAAELIMTLNFLAGSDAAIIATISSSAQQMKLVARVSGFKPGDLRGKRIGTVRGTSAEYFLDSWLLDHDIALAAVTIAPLPPDRLAGALQTNEVDAIAIWEPIASNAAALLGLDARVLPNSRVYAQRFSLIASRAALIRRDADLVRLLRALAGAERFIADDPVEARRLLATRLPGAAAPERISEHDFRLVLEQALIGTMDAQARWALRQGLTTADLSRVNLLHAIEPGPLQKASPGAVGLVH